MAWKNGKRVNRTSATRNADNESAGRDESRVQAGAGDVPNSTESGHGSAAGGDDSEPIRITREPEILGPDEAEPAGDDDGNASSSGHRRSRNTRQRSGNSRSDTRTSAGNSQKKKVFVEKTLYSIHLILAHLTNVEEIALPKDEAELLAEAIADVGKHFKVVVSPKMDALSSLGFCVAGIYGPRLWAYLMRDKKQPRNTGGIHEVK